MFRCVLQLPFLGAAISTHQDSRTYELCAGVYAHTDMYDSLYILKDSIQISGLELPV